MDETKATYTSFLNLEKAGRKQKYDIGVFNSNFDLIDKECNRLSNQKVDKKQYQADMEDSREIAQEFFKKYLESQEKVGQDFATKIDLNSKEDKGVAKRLDEELERNIKLKLMSIKGDLNHKEDKGVAKNLDYELKKEIEREYLTIKNAEKKYLTNNDFPINKSENGWYKLPNGLILQWGRTEEKGSDSRYDIKFPISFNKVYGCNVTQQQTTKSGGDGDNGIIAGTFYKTGFSYYHGADAKNCRLFWFAWGI